MALWPFLSLHVNNIDTGITNIHTGARQDGAYEAF